MAAKVGWAIKKFNLASERMRSGKKGISYRFKKEKIEKVYLSYFPQYEPSQPSPGSETQENTGPNEMKAFSEGVEECRTDLHQESPSLQTYTENNAVFTSENRPMKVGEGDIPL